MKSSPTRLNHTVTPSEDGQRLSKLVRHAFPSVLTSRSIAHSFLKSRQILVNDIPAEDSRVVHTDDRITLIHDTVQFERSRNNIDIPIVYEDRYLAVVHKPSNLTCQTAPEKNVEHVLKFLLSFPERTEQDGPSSDEYLERPQCINQLGKSLTGLVLVAKTVQVRKQLIKLWKNNMIQTRYRALVIGSFPTANSRSSNSLSTESSNKIQPSSQPHIDFKSPSEIIITDPIESKPASTRLTLIQETKCTASDYISSVDAEPISGFVGHQIQIHCLNAGIPVIGNSGDTRQLQNSRQKGMFLMLRFMKFRHPVTGETMEFEVAENPKFEALRNREMKFWEAKQKRMLEELEKAGVDVHVDAEEMDLQKGKPVAYIAGHKEFFGLTFTVSPAVMIPRPSTETLISKAIPLLSNSNSPKILDLGTGSGCILLSILHHVKNAVGIGLDVSDDALCIARQNAIRHNLTDRAKFINLDFSKLNNLPNQVDCFPGSLTQTHHNFKPPFDMIVSNPPYLPSLTSTSNHTVQQQSQMITHEPSIALFSGTSGLESYETIVQSILTMGPKLIKIGGHVLFEAGLGQFLEVTKLVERLNKEVMGGGCRLELVEVVESRVGGPRCLVYGVVDI
ncbi:S-adenosyl-L-methionine-dependent methyltransferase [Paraphysoderma sedebokerense]|nr:S-adenosyl-L-methionine-dependent methyltransferase [Paraphysoderma sedebokerense]